MSCILKKISVLFLMIVIIVTVLFSMNQPLFAERVGQSDAQEALIKKVISESAAHFGWDQSYCWTHQPPGRETVPSGDGWILQDRQPVTMCPTLWGPREMLEKSGDQWIPMAGAGYGIYVYAPVPDYTLGLEETVFRIFAYPTVGAAKADMDDTLSNLIPQYSTTLKIHGYPAVKTFDTLVDWQAGRFMFSTSDFYDSKKGKTISAEELAEVFYQNAVKNGLIQASGTEQDAYDDTGNEEESEPEIRVSAEPMSFSKPGDRGTIRVTLTGSDGAPEAGVTVILYDADTNFTLAEGTTDASGKTTFVVEHHDETRKSYTYQLQTPLISKTITIPVLEMGIQLELNPMTGTPFKGLASDSISTLEIMVKLDGAEGGELRLTTRPSLGELTGEQLTAGGTIELVNGEAIITYTPPDYLTAAQLTKQSMNLWSAVDTVEFTFTVADGRQINYPLEIEIFRPPVIMVHGFTGDRTTWARVAENLQSKEKFNTYSGQYYYLDESIEAQSLKLKNDIDLEIFAYLSNDIKLSKLDIVAHSMGGLISRNYISNNQLYGNNVRKLIMVGTPNHGCSWNDLQIGRFQAWLGGQHKIAAEQLYGKSKFIIDLNQGEAMGLHLHSDVEYGNIYSYGALPGFFSGDVVVSAASAHLNGARNYMLNGYAHSPAVSLMVLGSPPAITQSDLVFNKVTEWLTTKMVRDPLAGVRIALVKGEGEVYIKYLDQFVLGQETPKTIVDPAALSREAVAIGRFDSVGTGPGSKATLHFFTNDNRWGSISLDENTELKIGFLSPKLSEIKLLQGSARFTSLKVEQKGHYSVDLAVADGRWQNVTSLDTDFVLTAGNETLLHSLEGALIFGAETLSGDLIDQLISSGENYRADLNGEIVPASAPVNTWWEDDFYSESPSLLDRFSNFKIVRLLQKLLTMLKSDEPADGASEDDKGITWVFLAALLVLAIMFALLIPLLKRKWFTVLAVMIIILILISSYLLYRLGWDKISSLVSNQDDASEIAEVNQEPVAISEEIPEPSTEIIPEPETSEVALNLEALVYNCRVLDLFGMSLEEIKAIIGNPDEEGWFAGDYYRWNDAGALIGNNENGIAQQSELFIAGSDMAMIRLDNFLSIREGSSFDDVRRVLGTNLAVEDWSDTEWFDYVLVYQFQEYEFIFNASNPAGPVSFIMAKRQ